MKRFVDSWEVFCFARKKWAVAYYLYRKGNNQAKSNKYLTNFDTKTDEELVALTLENQDVFAWLIKRYENKFKSYIRRLTNCAEEEQEDLLQDIFIKIYRYLNNFNQDLKFSSWAYRIAHNEIISSFRKRQRRPIHNPGEENDYELMNLASDFDIAKEIDQESLKKIIFSILDNLDSKYRDVLILKYFEEKDYQEISDILKKPIGTIATLLNRAKKEFRNELEKNKINLKN